METTGRRMETTVRRMGIETGIGKAPGKGCIEDRTWMLSMEMSLQVRRLGFTSERRRALKGITGCAAPAIV